MRTFNPNSLEDVRELLNIRKDDIIRKYRAEGVGIGKLTPQVESYAIVVYIAHKGLKPKREIVIDGISLRFEITGKFRPHSPP